MLSKDYTLMGIQPTYVLESIHIVHKFVAVHTRFHILKGNTPGSGYSFLDSLIAASIAGQENTEAVGGPIDAFKTGDIDVIVRQEKSSTKLPLIRYWPSSAQKLLGLMSTKVASAHRRKSTACYIYSPDGAVSGTSKIH